jgi:hemoglobin-like flavoprotein
VSPEQIACVRTTVNKLAGREDELVAAFADGLAVLAPSALRLVQNRATAGEAVLRELRAFARLATDFPELEAWARQLGSATGSAVTATELTGIGGALIDALATVLGSDFGPDDRDAWHGGVALVSELVR